MLEFRLFGGAELRERGQDQLDDVLAGSKRLALLAYLALERPRGFQRRDAVVGLLWPEFDQSRARHALRNTLHAIRSAGTNGLIVNRGTEEIGLSDALWFDVAAFEAEIEGGRPIEATELYRGELLPAFHLADSPDFEHWLGVERRRLRHLAVHAASEAADECEVVGRGRDAVRYARRAVQLDPSNERTVRSYIELLLRLGDRARALRAYENFAARLRREFGLEPSAETQSLVAPLTEGP